MLALFGEFIGQRVFGGGLEIVIERRRDDEILVDRADRVGQHVHHIVRGVVDRAGAVVAMDAGGIGQGDLGHRLGDVALLRHRGDDLRRAFAGALGVAVRRELARRLHQPGQHGGLGQRHGLGAVAVIALGRRLDAIGAGAEIDAVQIKLEDLVLGIFMFEPERENRLLNLAGDRAFLR